MSSSSQSELQPDSVIHEAQGVEESLREITETAKNLTAKYEIDTQTKQYLQSKSIALIINIHRLENIPPEWLSKEHAISCVFAMLEPLYKDEVFERIRWGILAEVCTQLSLEKSGFTLIPLEKEADLYGATDILADPKESDGTLIAIQVKGTSIISEIQVTALDQNDWRRKLPEHLTREQYEKIQKTRKRMITYFNGDQFAKAHPELMINPRKSSEQHRPIRLILIQLPVQDVTTINPQESVSVFKNTGEPLPNTPNLLYDELAKALGWDQDN